VFYTYSALAGASDIGNSIIHWGIGGLTTLAGGYVIFKSYKEKKPDDIVRLLEEKRATCLAVLDWMKIKRKEQAHGK